ncbi:hypothetical protein JL720_5642 [Aureococcus anophagefferens]|nr:hypothetical protein JL720_5642 [Aureococcus anophagefferens]
MARAAAWCLALGLAAAATQQRHARGSRPTAAPSRTKQTQKPTPPPSSATAAPSRPWTDAPSRPGTDAPSAQPTTRAPTRRSVVVLRATISTVEELEDSISAAPATPGAELAVTVATDALVLERPLRIERGRNVVVRGGSKVVLSGDGRTRLFEVEGGASLSLEGLVLRDGSADEEGGGCVRSAGALRVGGGGAVATAGGSMSLSGCVFEWNTGAAGADDVAAVAAPGAASPSRRPAAAAAGASVAAGAAVALVAAAALLGRRRKRARVVEDVEAGGLGDGDLGSYRGTTRRRGAST